MKRLAPCFGAKLIAPFRVSLVLFIVALALAFFPVGARAQDLAAVSCGGTVSDQNGAVLPGARVTATLVETNSARAVATDDEGRYRLVKLPPGPYTLRAERAGFAAREGEGG